MRPDHKIVAVIRRPAAGDRLPPPIPGLRAATLHLPAGGEGGGDPDVVAVWMVWVDDPSPAAGAFADASAVYLVDERVQWLGGSSQGDAPPETTPGVKRLSFLRAAPGLTRPQFGDHWRDRHAPLARRHHPALWRYVQNVVIETLTPATPEIDGIAELSFLSVSDLRDRMYDSPAGRAAVGADVRRFIDLAAGWRVLTTEHPFTVSDSNTF